jgi:hypothetical protein
MLKKSFFIAALCAIIVMAFSAQAMARSEYLYIGERNHETVFGKIINKKGKPIVARVELWYEDINLDGISEEYGTPTPEDKKYLRQLFHSDFSDEKGWYHVNAFPGNYILRISKGPEWEIVEIPITVEEMDRVNGSPYRELDGQRHDITLKRLYNLQKYGYYPGDTHHHTIHSDGRNTPGQVYNSALASGLSWCTLTDHNNNAQNEVWSEYTSHKFLAIPGVEITTGNTPEDNAIHKGWGHQNALGVQGLPGAIDPDNPILWDRYIYSSWEDVQRGIDETHAEDGLFMLNHVMSSSNWFGGSISTWGQIKNYDAIEVWNSYHGDIPFSPWTARLESPDTNVWNQHTVSFQTWFEFLNAGNRLAGLASSDSHDATGLNQGGKAPIMHRGITGFATTYVHAKSLKWRNIRSGLKNGNVFLTAGALGPLLLTECEHKIPGEEIKLPKNGKVKLKIKVLSNRPLEDYPNGIRIIMNGEVIKEIPTEAGSMKQIETVSIPVNSKKDSWIIVDAWGEWPSYAVTNPFYIDVDRDGHWGARQWTFPEGAEEWMNPWPKAPAVTVPDGPGKPWFADEIPPAPHRYGNPINVEDWLDEDGLPIIP